jgi:hypothetical protein
VEDPAAAFARAGEAMAQAATSIGATVAATPVNGGAQAAATAEARRAAREAATTTPPAESAAARRRRTARPGVPIGAPESAGISRETTLDEAAVRLANDLRAIPGIERFGAIRLAELDRGGPRPLRTMWRIARDQLDERYGQLTIGDMLERYAGRGGGGTSASA